MQTLKILFFTSRPISWINTAYPFALGYVMLGGAIDARLIIGTMFFLVPYNLLMYGLNDIEDYESDMRNPRKGGVEGAVTPKRYHKVILAASIASSLPFVLALLGMGSFMSGLVLAVVLFFVVAYSAKGLRFKEVPFLDSITSSMHFVGPLLYAMSLIGANQVAWIAAGAFFLWGMASQAFGAVQDIVPDRAAGIDSIATKIGARATVRFSALLYLLASVAVTLTSVYALPVALIGLLYVVNVWQFKDCTDRSSGRSRRGWKRFLYLNYASGAVVTICCIVAFLA